jgi:hypothetical protein
MVKGLTRTATVMEEAPSIAPAMFALVEVGAAVHKQDSDDERMTAARACRCMNWLILFRFVFQLPQI